MTVTDPVRELFSKSVYQDLLLRVELERLAVLLEEQDARRIKGDETGCWTTSTPIRRAEYRKAAARCVLEQFGEELP